MGSRGLLLTVTFLGLIAGGILFTEPPGPKTDYMIIVPFELISGSQSKVCMWLKSEDPMKIMVDLEYSSEKMNIVNKPHTSDYYECTEFTVPEVGEEELVFFSFTAYSSEVDVADETGGRIDVPRSGCLTQKNKSVYNQGDPMQVKMVCFDENMNQVVRNFKTATLVDPNGAHVDQILNPSTIHGVVEVAFQLSPLAMPGYWQIKLEDDKEATEFVSAQVNGFEQPRVDWKANCPDTISVLDGNAEITGTAEFTHREPVPGTAVVRCCRTVPKYGRKDNCYRGIDDICQEFTVELDENGKFRENRHSNPFSGLSNYMCDITMKGNRTDDVYPSSCYMQMTNKLPVTRMEGTFSGSCYNKVRLPVAPE